MPKYVFELSAILPAGESLTPALARALSQALESDLKHMLVVLNHPRHEVYFDEPFEHVTGDNLPPDANGIVKLGPSRPIDL